MIRPSFFTFQSDISQYLLNPPDNYVTFHHLMQSHLFCHSDPQQKAV
jgi:hypothetical protein